MMRLSSYRQNILYASLCSSLLLMSACTPDLPPEEIVEERANARWEAILGDELAAAYEYLSPGTRSSITSAQYQRSILQKQVEWADARYIGSKCTESTCKVRISLDYILHGALPGVKTFKGTKEIVESWVLVDGNWYLVP